MTDGRRRSAPGGWARRWRGSLARDGHELVLWNRTPAAPRRSPTAGRPGRGRRREAAVGDTDVAFTMLADRPAVEAVYQGPDGVLAGAHAGLVLRRDEHRRRRDGPQALAAERRGRGGRLLDAPVSG